MAVTEGSPRAQNQTPHKPDISLTFLVLPLKSTLMAVPQKKTKHGIARRPGNSTPGYGSKRTESRSSNGGHTCPQQDHSQGPEDEKRPSVNDEMQGTDKTWPTHTTGHDAATERSGALTPVTTWTDPEHAALSGRSQPRTATWHRAPYPVSVNRPEQANPQRQKAEVGGARGRGTGFPLG